MNPYKVKTMKKYSKLFGWLLVFVLVIAAMIAIPYTHETTETIKVLTLKDKVTGTDGSTTTQYLVITDQGTYRIEPDGPFYSKCFGQLKEGETYTVRLRGYSFPVLGVYPYIIETL